MSITATYVSTTSFTVVGDKESEFNEGKRTRCTCSGSYDYGTVVSSSYSSPDTTVTITGDPLNSGLTAVEYGITADGLGSLPEHVHDGTQGEGGSLSAENIIVETINGPTYNDVQEWINNTQSAGRMSGGETSTHSDAITAVTVSGAGSGEFKVAGDQTAGYIAADPIRVTGSTNNDGYYTVASGVAYSGGTTTIPVDEAVGAIADGDIENGKVDVAAGTGFLKTTDSDIGDTVSFDLVADTNITLTNLATNYVYVDYNAGTPDIKTTDDRSSIEWNRQFPLAMVYRNGARTWVCSCGIYLPNKTRLDHERVLTLRGYERATGGEISDGGTRFIDSTAGVFYRGSNEISTTAKESDVDKLTTVYYNGSAWVWTEDLTQVDNTYYNNIASGLVELTTSRYAVHWVCIDYLSNLYVVYGRGDYTLPQAELAGVPDLMPVVANEFGIVAAKIIIQKSSATFAEIISAYTQLIPSTTPAVHNNLSGLNEGDYKHLTAAAHTIATQAATDSLDGYATSTQIGKLDGIATGADVTADNAPQAHNHDGVYYTETEVNTWRNSVTQTEMGYVNGVTSDIQTQLGTKLANVSEDTTPELGGQLVVGELDIKLDALLSAVSKYSGTTEDGVLGDTLVFGDLVYLNKTDGRWEKCDADADATAGKIKVAIVLAGGGDGDTKLLLRRGHVRKTGWNFANDGEPLYVSTTAGGITDTVVSGTGDIVRVVGYATPEVTQIDFNPSKSWVELS